LAQNFLLACLILGLPARYALALKFDKKRREVNDKLAAQNLDLPSSEIPKIPKSGHWYGPAVAGGSAAFLVSLIALDPTLRLVATGAYLASLGIVNSSAVDLNQLLKILKHVDEHLKTRPLSPEELKDIIETHKKGDITAYIVHAMTASVIALFAFPSVEPLLSDTNYTENTTVKIANAAAIALNSLAMAARNWQHRDHDPHTNTLLGISNLLGTLRGLSELYFPGAPELGLLGNAGAAVCTNRASQETPDNPEKHLGITAVSAACMTFMVTQIVAHSPSNLKEVNYKIEMPMIVDGTPILPNPGQLSHNPTLYLSATPQDIHLGQKIFSQIPPKIFILANPELTSFKTDWNALKQITDNPGPNPGIDPVILQRVRPIIAILADALGDTRNDSDEQIAGKIINSLQKDPSFATWLETKWPKNNLKSKTFLEQLDSLTLLLPLFKEIQRPEGTHNMANLLQHWAMQGVEKDKVFLTIMRTKEAMIIVAQAMLASLVLAAVTTSAKNFLGTDGKTP
jgi:hypothetical protein